MVESSVWDELEDDVPGEQLLESGIVRMKIPGAPSREESACCTSAGGSNDGERTYPFVGLIYPLIPEFLRQICVQTSSKPTVTCVAIFGGFTT